MKLLIIKDNFEIKRIHFRKSRSSIKLMYDINNIFMIGITLKLRYNRLKYKDLFIYLFIDNEDILLLKKIDDYFSKKLYLYESFIINNNIIKIKKHQGFNEDLLNKHTIDISINSIKYINGMNKVQIFSI
tara:strand:- start:792 stop:1181 length:390 start_codon:yes stop_codon:yes gene_type:complete